LGDRFTLRHWQKRLNIRPVFAFQEQKADRQKLAQKMGHDFYLAIDHPILLLYK